ncbi:MAG TPA: hypothetical protein ENI57_02230 [Ignavibacteria bacterium]|nr:hypothetical protein [Ignavibacteria bacterium]
MKQQLILWIAALAITFISGYANRITSKEYPVTGTVKYNTHKISYLFDKVYRGNDDYKFQVFSKLKGLKIKLQYKKKDDLNWNEKNLTLNHNIYSAAIPNLGPSKNIIYRAELDYNNDKIIVPNNEGVKLTFWGRTSKSIMLFYNLALFFGIFLTTRIGLEFFNENEKIKKLSLFPLIFFIFYGMLIVPVKRTYELSAFGNKIPQIDQLFDIRSLAFLTIWIVAIILIFNSKRRKIVALVSAVILLLLYGINI